MLRYRVIGELEFAVRQVPVQQSGRDLHFSQLCHIQGFRAVLAHEWRRIGLAAQHPAQILELDFARGDDQLADLAFCAVPSTSAIAAFIDRSLRRPTLGQIMLIALRA